jgi:hypothetical protein
MHEQWRPRGLRQLKTLGRAGSAAKCIRSDRFTSKRNGPSQQEFEVEVHKVQECEEALWQQPKSR